MKQAFFLFLLSFALVACGGPESSTRATEEIPEIEGEVTEDESPEAAEEAAVESVRYADPRGAYVGMFDAEVFDEAKNYTPSNKITMVIEKMADGKIEGRSIVAGNFRPFSGTYQEVDGYVEASVAEPGDDRYDGKFEFSLDPDGAKLSGAWIANDKNLAVTRRSFELERREFSYDPKLELPDDIVYAEIITSVKERGDNEGEFVTSAVTAYNSSTKKLTNEDVENMFKGDLEVIRNSIYARHGYSFKNRRMRYLFDNYVDWYMPWSTDVRADLTDLEKANIDLLKRYEDHAAEYYDYFGR